MKKDISDGCKKADCLYYDHKNFSNNCSASATQHKRKYGCYLYEKVKKRSDVIKIEIEIKTMPENCHVCPLKHYVKSEVDSGYFCYKTKQLIQKQLKTRPTYCPLIEEKNETRGL